MMSAALTAAQQSSRKLRGVSQGPEGWRYDFDKRLAIAPDGTRYPWKGAGDPTEADLDEVIASHRQSRRGTVAKGGSKNPKTQGLIGGALDRVMHATPREKAAAAVAAQDPIETLAEPAPGAASFSDITKNVLEPASRIISDTMAKVGEYGNPLALATKGLANALPAAKPVDEVVSGIARGGGRLAGGLVDVPGMLALASNPNPKVIAQGFYDTVSKTWEPGASAEDRVVGLGTAVLTLLGLKHGVSSFREFAKTRNAGALAADLKAAGATDAQAQGAALAAERALGPKPTVPEGGVGPQVGARAGGQQIEPKPGPVEPAGVTGGKEPWQMTREEFEAQPGIVFHGTPAGDYGPGAIHVGTKRAAQEALESRIGIPADGKGWRGQSKYGDTLLAGKRSIQSGKYGKYRETGFNTRLPEDDFYLRDHPELAKNAKFSDGSVVPLSFTPDTLKARITGEMTNSSRTPMSDTKANATIRAMQKRGVAKRGYYYENIGEDAGSISAVVPSRSHLETVSRKAVVETALREGKPVPPEVLADYPDLAAKYGKPKEPVAPVADVAEPKGGKAEPQATGLANQVQAREAEAGILKDIPATAGKSPEQWQEIGKKEFGDGYDFEALAERVAKGEEELTGAKVGILLEGKRRLMAERNNLAKRLAENPGDKAVKAEIAKLDERIGNFAQNVQVGKGAWSDVGRALQAGATLDEGNFAQVLERMSESGRAPSERLQKEVQRLTEQVAERDQKIADLQSGAASVRQVKTRLSKDSILKEIDDIGAEWEKLKSAGSGSRNPKVTKQQGAILITRQDLANLGKRGELIARYIKAHAKLGAASVEEFVKTVKVNLLEKLGVDVGDQLVIDVAVESAPRPSPTELQKQGASLRAKLKRASTKGEADRIADLEAQIRQNKRRLDLYGAKGQEQPVPRVVAEQIKNLQAERDIWASRVRAQMRAHDEGIAKRLAQGAAQTVRGTMLGSDIGILTRQGLFSLSRPLEFAKGVGSGVKAAISETNLAKMERAMDERTVAGRKAILAEKEAGLQRTSHFGGFNQQEELTLARLFQAVPEFVAKGLDKVGAKPVGSAVRKVGQLGGSLERFQHAFINKVRAEAFDRALRLGYSADELKARARFINNATGRGNFKNVPTALQAVLTSPRYEASRWAMLAEPIRNPARVMTDLVTGKGFNRGAAVNIQDMAITAAEIYGLYKLAEGAGYTVNLDDPTSADFLKLRKGKEVWDPSAGIAPRLRDTIRVAVAFFSPEYAKEHDFDFQSAAGKAVTRTISPAVRTPIEQGYQAVQRRHNVSEEDLRSFFTGRKIDPEDAKGWFAFAPLIVQTFWQTLREEDPKAAAEAGLKEFVGQSVNRYPKPGGK